MKGKHKGANQWTSQNNQNQEQKGASPELTQQDQEYVQAHEDEINFILEIYPIPEAISMWD